MVDGGLGGFDWLGFGFVTGLGLSQGWVGSIGLDGLAGMAAVSAYNDTLMILRPFLDVPKADLLAYCAAQAVDYVRDPSNENEDFARPRLRAARGVEYEMAV